MFVELFVCLWTMLANFAEQRRNGTLPEVVPAAAPAQQSRARTEELRPRERGRVEQRSTEAASGGGAMHGPLEQPEINEPIGEQPTVPQRRSRVRKLKVSSGPAPARPRHVGDGRWLLWRSSGIVWTAQAAAVGFNSKKWVFAGEDSCGQFVTI